jgi:hypothetical protein
MSFKKSTKYAVAIATLAAIAFGYVSRHPFARRAMTLVHNGVCE